MGYYVIRPCKYLGFYREEGGASENTSAIFRVQALSQAEHN